MYNLGSLQITQSGTETTNMKTFRLTKIAPPTTTAQHHHPPTIATKHASFTKDPNTLTPTQSMPTTINLFS